MGLPPNPATELAGGIQAFTSGASSTNIPTSLTLEILITFVAYNLVKLFELSPLAIINATTSAYNSSVNWIKSIYTSYVNHTHLLANIFYILKRPVTNATPTITTHVLTTPNTTEAVTVIIHGLPSHFSPAQLTSFLSTALYVRYHPQIQAQLVSGTSTTHTNAPTPEGLQIYTSVSEPQNHLRPTPPRPALTNMLATLKQRLAALEEDIARAIATGVQDQAMSDNDTDATEDIPPMYTEAVAFPDAVAASGGSSESLGQTSIGATAAAASTLLEDGEGDEALRRGTVDVEERSVESVA